MDSRVSSFRVAQHDVTKSTPVWAATLCLVLTALEYIIQDRWTGRKIKRRKENVWIERWTDKEERLTRGDKDGLFFVLVALTSRCPWTPA